MPVQYDEETKALPIEPLNRLFVAVGWSDGQENEMMRKNFNKPFIGSTYVVSAWDGDELIGTVRALSDGVVRAEVYDLAVLPSCQGRGVGRELLRRVVAKCPGAEWYVRTTPEKAAFYMKQGFTLNTEVALSKASIYF